MPADTLAGEQALLDRSLAALRSGDAATALALIGEHAARYPSGALVEEREVLAIRALVRGGDGDAARRRAERFRSRFPTSIQLEVIDALVHD